MTHRVIARATFKMRKIEPFHALFAPGAGAPSTSGWMSRYRALLAKSLPVDAFDYPYMLAGRGRPDPHDTLVAAHRAAFDRVAGADRHVVLVGKSMGSRIGCHLSVELARANAPHQPPALVCFGYPLVSPGKKKALRDAVLRELSTPILFVQGTRDPLCPLDLLGRVRREMRAPSELLVIDSGDHSLECTKTWLKEHGETQAEVDERIVGAAIEFVLEHTRSLR